jgi:hypothetical protein
MFLKIKEIRGNALSKLLISYTLGVSQDFLMR